MFAQKHIQPFVAKLRLFWKSLDQESRWMLLAAATLMLGYFGYLALSGISTPKGPEVATLENPFRMDMAIPEGWSLVPFPNVSNQAALDAIVEAYALVDVFGLDHAGRPTALPILSDARLVRLPKDKGQFGVVVPGELVARLTQATSVFVTVKNPQHAKTTQAGRRKSSRITIGGHP